MAWAIKLSNGYVTDDVTRHPKVLSDSKVGYPSDSLASCVIANAYAREAKSGRTAHFWGT